MDKSHNYDHSHTHDNQNLKPIMITFILNVLFAIIEFIGFLFSGSMILYSSSIHDIGDSATLFATLLIERKANNGRDSIFTYGYRRFTLIGSIINYTILGVGSTFAIIESIQKLTNLEPFDPYILLYTSALGIVINLVGFKLVNTGQSISNKALAANLFADIANFIAIFISSIIIINFDTYILDPLFSIVFSIYLIVISLKAYAKIFKMIMQAIPENIDYEQIRNAIIKHKFILDAHDIHIWDLDSEDYILTVHIVVKDNLNDTQIMEIKEHIRRDLETFKINHSTIEVDTLTHAKFNGELSKEYVESN
ncbi:cation diffusion facilitator family transporter [Mollicutes bacterium LVI A0039]|nr:cation diffusion facilitator family transporter [Mollicutes bacterium LVI A0039]